MRNEDDGTQEKRLKNASKLAEASEAFFWFAGKLAETSETFIWFASILAEASVRTLILEISKL